ncbi:hypothetical protein TNCV_1939201 [Trichonephila clavipes]|nr:hypothetical protein TNCV_1939201 [Trichonephila clavipes]
MTVYDNKDVDTGEVEGEVQLLTDDLISKSFKFATNTTTTYFPVSDSANRRTNDTIVMVSVRVVASFGVRQLVGCVMCVRRLCWLRHVSDGLVAFVVDRWRHDCCTKVAVLFVRPESPKRWIELATLEFISM